jgi:hypothetical protein
MNVFLEGGLNGYTAKYGSSFQRNLASHFNNHSQDSDGGGTVSSSLTFYLHSGQATFFLFMGIG